MSFGKRVDKAISKHGAIMVAYCVKYFRGINSATTRTSAATIPFRIASGTFIDCMNAPVSDSFEFFSIYFHFSVGSNSAENSIVIVGLVWRRHIGANSEGCVGRQTNEIVTKAFALGIVNQVRRRRSQVDAIFLSGNLAFIKRFELAREKIFDDIYRCKK